MSDSYMRVGALRASLEGVDDDMLVIIQKDAEGNDYSPLAMAEEARYVAERPWFGECYMTDEQVDADPNYTDEDKAPEGAVPCWVLVPVN